VELAGGEQAFRALQPGPELERVLGAAAQASFREVALLPAILLVVFGGIWLYDRVGRPPKKPGRIASGWSGRTDQ
jgi:hypothetical protein